MARRRRPPGPQGDPQGPVSGESLASYAARFPQGAIARWVAAGPIPDWVTIGSYEEFGAGLICGDELPGRIAEDHRRRQKPPRRR
jgi:hypothetical protein